MSNDRWIEGVKKEQGRWRREDTLTSAIHCNKQSLNPAFTTATAQYRHKSNRSIFNRSTKVRTKIQLCAGFPRKSVLNRVQQTLLHSSTRLQVSGVHTSAQPCPALPDESAHNKNNWTWLPGCCLRPQRKIIRYLCSKRIILIVSLEGTFALF